MELGSTLTRRVENSFNVPLQVMESSYIVEEKGEVRRDSDKLPETRDGFLLTEALRVAERTPDIRKSKVEALKARIASGEYEVDALALARALVKEEGALFA